MDKLLACHAGALGSIPSGGAWDFGFQYSPELDENFGIIEFCRYGVYICELPPSDLRVYVA